MSRAQAAVCIERSPLIAILMADKVFLVRAVRLGENEGAVSTEAWERARSVNAIVGEG